jgi:hypothetical protein
MRSRNDILGQSICGHDRDFSFRLRCEAYIRALIQTWQVSEMKFSFLGIKRMEFSVFWTFPITIIHRTFSQTMTAISIFKKSIYGLFDQNFIYPNNRSCREYGQDIYQIRFHKFPPLFRFANSSIGGT